MTRIRKHTALRRLAAALLCLLVMAGSLPVLAEDGAVNIDEKDAADRFGMGSVVTYDENGEPALVNGYPCQTASVAYFDKGQMKRYDFVVDILDYPFWQDATQYDGNLAVMSLAMALSASRPLAGGDGDEKPVDSSENLKVFLADAGFEDIRTDDYSKATSMYTVATGIGQRRMEAEGQEPFTLIAVGICGSNYQNEWQSNMTPGDGDIHEGFHGAAQLVMDRLAGYVATRGIEGRVKVWISGFSRAAAISNLVAAGLAETGMLPKMDVYAYTFATPAAVKSPPAEGYENIFNIICPTDPVPQVMPAEWGFGRYGQDRYLAVEEFSSFLGWLVTSQRAETDRELFHVENNYSPQLNLRIRLLYSLLLDVLQSREYYNQTFQPALVGIMQNKTVPNTLTTLRNLMRRQENSGVDRRVDMDELMDFFIRVFSRAATRTDLGDNDLNTATTLYRLFNEHNENSYLSDAQAIQDGVFESATEACYVMVRGPVTVSIVVEEDSKVETAASIDARGNRSVGEKLGDLPDFQKAYYMERMGDTTIACVPRDIDYQVIWTAEGDGTVECMTAGISVRAGSDYPGWVSGAIRVKAGDTGLAFCQKDGGIVPRDGFEARTLEARDIAEFIGIASLGVNWRVALTIGCALFGLAVCALACAFAARMQRNRKRCGFLYWLAICVYGVAFIEMETAYWFFADMPALPTLWKVLAGVCLLLVFFRACPPGKPLWDTILPTLALAVAGDIVMSVYYKAGAAIYLLCHAALILYCQRRHPLSRGRWVRWALFAIPVTALIATHFAPAHGVVGWAAAAFAPALLLLAFSMEDQSGSIRAGATLLGMSDVLLGLFFTLYNQPVAHMAYGFLFYAALLALANERAKALLAAESLPGGAAASEG